MAYTKNVNPLYQAVLKTFTEQSDGWKKRNIVFRQWLFQNFKKTTDMSVEEMRLSLNSLGDKLARHESTDQFIKPLTQLNAYYKQQLDQLKGMDKVSRNQGENLETVKEWVAQVDALLEALNN
jgi:RNase adaptor protein for sRNA GlmZ degradation